MIPLLLGCLVVERLSCVYRGGYRFNTQTAHMKDFKMGLGASLQFVRHSKIRLMQHGRPACCKLTRWGVIFGACCTILQRKKHCIWYKYILWYDWINFESINKLIPTSDSLCFYVYSKIEQWNSETCKQLSKNQVHRGKCMSGNSSENSFPFILVFTF